MFKKLRLRGRGHPVLRGELARISLGYYTAAVVRTWTVYFERPENGPPKWALQANVDQVDAFRIRQRELLFSAPRKGGFLVWPLLEPPRIQGTSLYVRLGPPEH